jgi:hypothetical protein
MPAFAGMTAFGSVIWRALRPFGNAQGMLSASHLSSDSVRQNATEKFKYVWLVF